MPRAITTTTASPVLRVVASATQPTRTGLTMNELYPAAVVRPGPDGLHQFTHPEQRMQLDRVW